MIQCIPKINKPVLTQNWIKLSYCPFSKHGSIGLHDSKVSQALAQTLGPLNSGTYPRSATDCVVWKQLTSQSVRIDELENFAKCDDLILKVFPELGYAERTRAIPVLTRHQPRTVGGPTRTCTQAFARGGPPAKVLPPLLSLVLLLFRIWKK